MRRHNLTACILLFFLCLFFAGTAPAVTNIDSTFGDDGETVLSIDVDDDEAFAVAVQSDGNIIAAGYTDNGAVKRMAVSRFTEDGEIDTDFSTAGTFTYTFDSSGDTIAYNVSIKDDDTIVVSGSSSGDEEQLFIIKLTEDGFLDTSFNTNGYHTFFIEDGTVTNSDVTLTSDDDILVAATISPDFGDDYGYVIKLDSGGDTDDSFDDDGAVSFEYDSGDLSFETIELQGDDDDSQILVAGFITVDDEDTACILRLDADGTIDTDYGSDGIATFTFGGNESVIYDIAVDEDDNVIAVGSIKEDDYDQTVVAKIDEDGSLVTDFNSSGYYTTTYSAENVAYAVTLEDDITITAVGFKTSDDNTDVFVLTLTENDSSEITATTYISTDIDGEDDIAYAAATLDDGEVVVAGSSDNGDDLDFAVLLFTDDTSLAVSSSDSDSDSVTTSGFTITTAAVTGITRVSASTGGTISQTDTVYDDDGDELEVEQRGVVYSTSTAPEYDSDDDEDSDDDSSDDSDDDSDDDDSTSSIFPDSIDYYTVSYGYVEDDDGDTGTYTSNLEDITPGTIYYVRAYAVLSDDSVIYGNQLRFITSDACFIATAAYGSMLEKHVVLLRQFRDSYLLTSSLGEQFVAMYYHYSPQFAEIIEENSVLKFMARVTLFPLMALAYLLLKASLLVKLSILCAGLTAITYIIFTYFNSNRVNAT